MCNFSSHYSFKYKFKCKYLWGNSFEKESVWETYIYTHTHTHTHRCVKWKKESEITQLCPILCEDMDCSLPGSTVHGIFQARILEWVAISFSRRSSWPRHWTQVYLMRAEALSSKPPGIDRCVYIFYIHTHKYMNYPLIFESDLVDKILILAFFFLWFF